MKQGSTATEADPRRDALLFGAIVLVAFLVRWIYLHQARAVPMFDALVEDGESYGAWSDRLAAGDWLGDRIFYQAPLYPYFLGVVKLLFGSSLATIRLVQIALGALSCGVLFLATKSFVTRAAGVTSGLLLAFYPAAIFFDGCIQKSNLGLFLLTLLLLALAKLRERPSAPRWLALGFVLALLMLTREEARLCVPVLLVVLAWQQRALGWPQLGRCALAFALGLALPLAPTAWRNHKVGGEWVLTTSQAGPNFFIGNNARATGFYVPLRAGRSNVEYESRDAREIAEFESKRSLSPAEVSDFWFAKSFAWIRSDVGGWIALLARKALLCVNAYELPDAEDLYFYERYAPLLKALDWLLPFGVLAPLGFAGIWHTRRRWRELAAPLALLATLGAAVVAVYVMARYRYSLVPILALFAGALLVELWQARRELARARSTLLVLGLAAVAVNWPLFARDWQLPASYGNAAITLEKKGDHEGAIALFRQALALRPDSAQTRGNLGLALEHAGRIDEAVAEYRAVLGLRQGNVYDLLRLANVLATNARRAEALPWCAQAEPLARNDALAWRDLATVYTAARRYADARRCAEQSLALDAKGQEARLRLAWVLAAAPQANVRDGAQALVQAQAAIGNGASSAFAREVLAAALAELGRFDEALAALAAAEAIAPGSAERERMRQSFAQRAAWRLPGQL